MGAINRAMQHVASWPAVTWVYLNICPPIDRRLLRWTGGRLSVSIGQPVVLLETTGAKSGLVRSTPLMSLRDGDCFVLIASNGGGKKHPAWYHNLRANPDATLTYRGSRTHYTAHEAEGDERVLMWKRATEAYVGFAKYEQRAGGRRIPVMVLEPNASA